MNYIKKIREKVGHEIIIMPCSSAIVIKDDKILLQFRTDFKKWAIHGGAIEIGETIEEALLREIKEELGIKIIDYRFFKNFSGKEFMVTYPNDDQVNIIDHVYIVTKFSEDYLLDKSEVLDLKWFKTTELPWDNLMPLSKIVLESYLDSIEKNK